MPFFVNFGYSRQVETKEAEMIDVHQNLGLSRRSCAEGRV